MQVAGHYHDGRSSRARPVTLDITALGVTLRGGELQRFIDRTELRIGERLGSTPRELRFGDGESCTVADGDALERALAAAGLAQEGGWLHRLEQHWGWALGALAVVIVLSVAAVIYGVPFLARHAAGALPPETDRRLGLLALEELDDHVFEPSALDDARQRQLQGLFGAMATEVPGPWQFRLELRASDRVGANAFALPGGIIIVTDGLVELAASDAEMQAVLAHEIGHVVHRHSLRMLLQNSLTALLMLSVLGDLSGATAVVVAVPTTLVQARHSRAFETEADRFAFAWLERHGLGRDHLGALLRRMEAADGASAGPPGFLATHPRTEERR